MNNIVLVNKIHTDETEKAVIKYLSDYCCQCCDGSFEEYSEFKNYIDFHIERIENLDLNPSTIRYNLLNNKFSSAVLEIKESLLNIEKLERSLLGLNIYQQQYEAIKQNVNIRLSRCCKTENNNG